MSEYSFGFDPSGDESDPGETGASQQGPKWFREGLDKLSNQVQELRAENAALKAQQVKDEVANALKAKGYDPAAAGLYTGTPEKLDDWLTAHGGALAKVAPEGQMEPGEVTPQGPPATTVSATGQEQTKRMMEQGTQGVAPPQGSDKELAAALAAARTREEYAAIMQANGSPYAWD